MAWWYWSQGISCHGIDLVCSEHSGPIFCLLLGVSSDYAQPITGQVTEVTCPVIGRAQPELTKSKRQKMGPGLSINRVNSLWPSDAIWWRWSRSTLVQLMACCLTAPSHYLNQCWLIINRVKTNVSLGHATWWLLLGPLSWYPLIRVKPLHFIWRLGTCWWHLPGADSI